MLLRDTCYFCTSPYQLIPIFSLAISRCEVADLYIDPQFKNAEVLAERIRKTNVFCNVFITNSKMIYQKYLTAGNKLLRHFQIANSYLKVDEIAKQIFLEDVIYKHMFVSSRAYIPRLATLYIIKNNIHTELLYFDDGIGSYYADAAYELKNGDRLVRKLLFGEKATIITRKRFLFSPEFYSLINPLRSDEIEKLPLILGNQRLISFLNSIFVIDERSLIKERFILLDVPKSSLFTEDNIKKINKLYRLIIEKAGNHDVIIKKHPSSLENEFKDIKTYSNIEIPFECLCLNTDMNRKVLISYGSTAVGTPKILLGQEPVIVLLYRLVDSKIRGYEHIMNEYFIKIQQLYVDKRKVIIPNSEDELFERLKMIN